MCNQCENISTLKDGSQYQIKYRKLVDCYAHIMRSHKGLYNETATFTRNIDAKNGKYKVLDVKEFAEYFRKR